MALLGRTDILSADDRKYEDVPCPEWGGDVRVRSMTGRQRDTFEAGLIEQRGNDRKLNMRDARARMIVMCAVDESGSLLFSADDLGKLTAKSAKPLDRLFDACKTLAGMNDDDVKKLTEDFDDAPDDDSSSD